MGEGDKLNLFEKLGFFIIEHFWKFMLFGFFGFCAFAIDWTFFNLFYNITSLFIFSMTSSAIISMVFNFNINRNITFKAKGISIKKQVIKWLIVYVIGISARIGLSKIILIILGEENLLNVNIAFIGGLAVAVPISFLGCLFWAFKKPGK